jgi:hypothetical protein
MSINLVLSNKPSLLNKKLINFFNSNLSTLINAQLVFDFEVANSNKPEEYAKRGITQYPILINDTTKVTGADKIIRYLNHTVATYNKKTKPKSNKTDDDYLDEYWKNAMGGVKINESGQIEDDDDDDDDENNPDISKKIQHAFQERNDNTDFEISKKGSSKNSSHNNNIKKGHTRLETDSIVDESPVTSLKNMGKNGKSMADDDLMAKFFENQEES